VGRKQNQLKRLKYIPKDFTFDEACSLLESYGYVMSSSGKTSGSRVKFYLGKKVFAMHKPHPRKELLEYQVKALLLELKEEGFYE
jgi:hypothetical protein